MYRHRATTSWLCVLLLLLAACDNGGGGRLNSFQDGIEGSGGKITTSGVVRATSSGIVVNGIEYAIDGASITVNGVQAFPDELASGHLAIVQAEFVPTAATPSAVRVDVEIAVAGRIASLDSSAGRFSVLGQVVAVNGSTIVDDVFGGSEHGLSLGSDVEVSGFADSEGVLHASRIASRRASTPFIVTGRVADLDADAGVFSINGQGVSYADATLRNLAAVADGLTVQVVARDLRQGVLIADTVAARTSRLPGAVGDAAAIEGLVTRFASLSDFEIDGRAVDGRAVAEDALVQRSGLHLDAHVSAQGLLTATGVMATVLKPLLPPGRVVGQVSIGDATYALSGVLTPRQDFRLSVGQFTGGPPETETSRAQLVGSFAEGPRGVGVGVLIGEDCAGPAPERFCGRRSPARLEITRDPQSVASTGVLRVETAEGEEVWPVTLGYWGGRSGFDPIQYVAGTYELAQTELVRGAVIRTTVDGLGRMFFQNPENSCIGNGRIGDMVGGVSVWDVRLTIDGCNAEFAYLNGDFQGLAHIESYTPWGYDWSILRLWLSTEEGAPSAAAISLWGQEIWSTIGEG